MKSIEKEIKIILNETEYEKLAYAFEWKKEFTQINYYYGNFENLKESNEDYTIRIREREEKFYLQIKIPIKNDKSLHIKNEYEEKIDCVREQIDKEELWKITKINFESNVNLLGKLVTYRKEYQISENVLICLDKNIFLNTEDYELEIEFKEEYPQVFIEYLGTLGIYLKEDCRGKFTRFLDTLVSTI